jgi:hypothetical protein
MEIISDQQYTNFINNDNNELFDILKNLISEENNIDDAFIKLQLFYYPLQKKYFNYLIENIFNTPDNESFYLNLKNNSSNIIKHIQAFYEFHFNRTMFYFIEKFSLNENSDIIVNTKIKYEDYFSKKNEIINQILINEHLPFFL